MDNIFKKIDPKKQLPPKNNNGKPSDAWSDSYFVMTDNGKRIAYYDFEENTWRVHTDDRWTDVVYWLEEIKER